MILADPKLWDLSTWLFATGFAVAGAIVNYIIKTKLQSFRVFDLYDLLGEIFIGGFVGVMAFIWAAQQENPLSICILAAGAGGHLSAKILSYVNKAADKKFGNEIADTIVEKLDDTGKARKKVP